MMGDYCVKKDKKKVSVLRRIYFLFIINALLFAGIFWQESNAAAKNVTSVEDIKDNVFRLETVCTVNNKDYRIKSATCFLIGDVEMEQEQYIVSTSQVLRVSDKEKKKLKKKHGWKKKQEMSIHYRVVVSSDIVLDAEVKTQAQDNDYAVLQLASTLADCRGIALGDIHQTESNQEIILLGYAAKGNEINLYTSEIDSQKTDEEKITYKGSVLTNSDKGAPIIDESGALLGMCTYLDKKGKFATGIAVNELRKVFNMLAINYQSADSKYSDLADKIKEAKKKAKDTSYKKSSIENLQEAIAQAEEVYNDKESANKEYQEEISSLNTAMDSMKKKSETYHVIMIILAVVAMGIIVGIVVILLKGQKSKKEIHYIEEGSISDDVLKNQQPDLSKAESIRDKKKVSAYLIDKKSGERIPITKEKFIVGSQSASVDYCILNNRSISRNHACILNQNGRFFLQDNHSLNHTYLNGRMLNAYENESIKNQDVIRFANEEFVFEMSK